MELSGGGGSRGDCGGDDVLDDLVHDLSKRVNATDGQWVRDNAGEGPSIFDDFEAALNAAPRMEVGSISLEGVTPTAPTTAAHADATMAAMLSSLSSGGRVIDLADLTEGDFASGGGGGGGGLGEVDLAGLQDASDQLAEMMLAMSSSSANAGGEGDDAGGSHTGGSDDALQASLAAMGLSMLGMESASSSSGTEAGGASNGDGAVVDADGELKGLLVQLASQLKAERRTSVAVSGAAAEAGSDKIDYGELAVREKVINTGTHPLGFRRLSRLAKDEEIRLRILAEDERRLAEDERILAEDKRRLAEDERRLAEDAEWEELRLRWLAEDAELKIVDHAKKPYE